MRKYSLQDWMVFICGIIVFVLGIVAIFMPSTVLYGVGVLVGIGILIQGISRLIRFFKGGSFLIPSGLILFGGIIDLIFGVIVLLNVTATTLALCLLIGIWFLFSSVMRIASSFELKKIGVEKWWLILILGIISTFLAFYVIWNPLAGAAVIVVTASIALLSNGIMMMAEAFNDH